VSSSLGTYLRLLRAVPTPVGTGKIKSMAPAPVNSTGPRLLPVHLFGDRRTSLSCEIGDAFDRHAASGLLAGTDTAPRYQYSLAPTDVGDSPGTAFGRIVVGLLRDIEEALDHASRRAGRGR
jgi:hypothetical protein